MYISKKEFRKMMMVKEVLANIYGDENVHIKRTGHGWMINVRPSFIHRMEISSTDVLTHDVTDILNMIGEGMGV